MNLYLSSWEYNSYLIINELAKIVKKEGGEVVTDKQFAHLKSEPVFIQNRSLEEKKADLADILKRRDSIPNKKYVNDVEKQLAELEKIKNDFIKVKYQNYLTFYYNNYIYYIELPGNPFFDKHYVKKPAKVEGDSYFTFYSYYLMNLDLDSIFSEYYSRITKARIKRIAEKLFNLLINSKDSDVVFDKIKVCNTYNSGSHTERIKKERKVEYIKEV